MRAPQRRAVTLIEVLLVIAILGLLLSIAIPAVQFARERARQAECQTRMHNLAVGVDLYHSARRRFPEGRLFGPYGKWSDSTAWSWIALTLPYLGEQTLYASGEIPSKKLKDSRVVALPLAQLRCPSDGAIVDDPSTDRGNLAGFAVGLANYQAVTGSNWGEDKSVGAEVLPTAWRHKGVNGSYDGWDEGDGIMFRTDYKIHRAQRDVTDGLSKTVMLGENLPSKNAWCSWPYSNNAYGTCAIPLNLVLQSGPEFRPLEYANVAGFRSDHPDGAYFAFADQSVRYLDDGIDLDVYRALATIAGHD